ncbi:hypothetical protein OROHE_014034 [Orobanche hederae]
MADYDLVPKKMVCSWSTLQTHKDVVTEMALHLPLQSLFRCRAVCKLWRDVIDSPSFRKLHNLSNYANDEDDTLYLSVPLNYSDFKFLGHAGVKVLINKFPENGILNLGLNVGYSPGRSAKGDLLRFTRAVNGLICLNFSSLGQPLAICNPFLGQIKILPDSSSHSDPGTPCERRLRNVGIGRDGEFYKVVEVAYCRRHHLRLTHARLYSRRTDSWRDLGLDQPMLIYKHVHLSCNEGRFAHWCAWTHPSGYVILTFDMTNEVFRKTKIPDLDSCSNISVGNFFGDRTVAKDDGCSFIRIVFPDSSGGLVRIYESSVSICEGIRKLSWYFVVGVELPVLPLLPWWRRDCVIVKMYDAEDQKIKHLFYDYRARRFVGCLNLPECSEFLDYKGPSFHLRRSALSLSNNYHY